MTRLSLCQAFKAARVGLAVIVGAALGACSLNPQPLPPGEGQQADGGAASGAADASDLGATNDASSTVRDANADADANVTMPGAPDDGGDGGDAADNDATDGAVDALGDSGGNPPSDGATE